MAGSVTIVRGDARALPLADNSVDLVVTSPPFWALRSYQDDGKHYAGQIGSEPTPGEYIDALIDCTREWMRVLKPSGSLWVNLGNKYSDRQGPQGITGQRANRAQAATYQRRPAAAGFRSKSLLLLPERYRIACTDQLGLIVRAVVIWSKPNGLPESVKDRVRRSHEDWVHMTVRPNYYVAIDDIREPVMHPKWSRPNRNDMPSAEVRSVGATSTLRNVYTPNERGRIPGSVWEVPTQPLTVPPGMGIEHFAAFPMEWPRRLIKGWCPTGVCANCGFLLGSSYDSGMLGVWKSLRAGRAQGPTEAVLLEGVRQSQHGKESIYHEVPTSDDARLCGDLEAGPPDGAEVGLPDGAPLPDGGAPGSSARSGRGRAPQERDQDGQPAREPAVAREARARQAAEARTGSVPLPALRGSHSDVRDSLPCQNCGGSSFRPTVVADPFGGTGTTALVAAMLGRTGITVDASADYCRLARWRCTDPVERARAAQVEPDRRPVDPGQTDLFGTAS